MRGISNRKTWPSHYKTHKAERRHSRRYRRRQDRRQVARFAWNVVGEAGGPVPVVDVVRVVAERLAAWRWESKLVTVQRLLDEHCAMGRHARLEYVADGLLARVVRPPYCVACGAPVTAASACFQCGKWNPPPPFKERVGGKR